MPKFIRYARRTPGKGALLLCQRRPIGEQQNNHSDHQAFCQWGGAHSSLLPFGRNKRGGAAITNDLSHHGADAHVGSSVNGPRAGPRRGV